LAYRIGRYDLAGRLVTRARGPLSTGSCRPVGDTFRSRLPGAGLRSRRAEAAARSAPLQPYRALRRILRRIVGR